MPSLAVQAADAAANKQSSQDWGVTDALRVCGSMESEYFGATGEVFWPIPHREAISRGLAFCDDEGIDPELYFRAQYDSLAWFFKNKKLKRLPASSFSGRKAADRYSRYVERSLKRGKHLRKRAAVDTEEPDHAYWDVCVSMAVTGPTTVADLDEIADAVTTEYPGWAPDPQSPTWLAAIASAMDAIVPSVSEYVHVDRNVCPLQVAEFLRRLRGPSTLRESPSLGFGQLSSLRT